ncbi:MAG TPA: exosortase K [Candidatus Binatia bacterium]|jgi:exosortase K
MSARPELVAVKLPHREAMKSALKTIRVYALRTAAYLLPALGLAVMIKYHYSRAGSEDLRWILCPTARVVELFSGIHFAEELHAGFISHSHAILIARACAGVNFLVVAFGVAIVSGLRHIKHTALRMAWLPAALACAYVMTIFVNAIRIVVSIYSYEARLFSSWIDPARLHLIEGVVIYSFFLIVFYRIIEAGLCRTERRAPAISDEKQNASVGMTATLPLFCYLTVTLVIPFLNGAARRDARFAEYGAIVLAASCAVGLFFWADAGWRWLSDRVKRRTSDEK